MALKDHLPRWVQRLLATGSNALGMHDAIEATFTEIKGDLDQAAADTFLTQTPEVAGGPVISSAGLDRWGTDLQEPRLADQTDTQFMTMLQQIKQGRAVNEDGIRYALDKWGLSYTLYEFGDISAYWDNGFYDVDIATVAPLTIQIVFADPWNGGTPDSTKPAKQQALSNAVRDANRVKARGVTIVAVVPSSLT